MHIDIDRKKYYIKSNRKLRLWQKVFFKLLVICIYLLGAKFLKLQFITSKKREAFFVFVILSIVVGILIQTLIVVYKNNEGFSSFAFLHNEWHWTNSLLSPIVFIVFEITIEYCLLSNCIFLISTLYVCLYSLKFWLEKLWYV